MEAGTCRPSAPRGSLLASGLPPVPDTPSAQQEPGGGGGALQTLGAPAPRCRSPVWRQGLRGARERGGFGTASVPFCYSLRSPRFLALSRCWLNPGCVWKGAPGPMKLTRSQGKNRARGRAGGKPVSQMLITVLGSAVCLCVCPLGGPQGVCHSLHTPSPHGAWPLWLPFPGGPLSPLNPAASPTPPQLLPGASTASEFQQLVSETWGSPYSWVCGWSSKGGMPHPLPKPQPRSHGCQNREVLCCCWGRPGAQPRAACSSPRL